jgi:hypothetical protein
MSKTSGCVNLREVAIHCDGHQPEFLARHDGQVPELYVLAGYPAVPGDGRLEAEELLDGLVDVRPGILLDQFQLIGMRDEQVERVREQAHRGVVPREDKQGDEDPQLVGGELPVRCSGGQRADQVVGRPATSLADQVLDVVAELRNGCVGSGYWSRGRPAGVRVFHGLRLTEPRTVVIDGAVIGSDSSGAREIDAAGAVLLPGLIDAHIHLHGRDTLRQLVSHGVTTGLDRPPGLANCWIRCAVSKA